MKFEALILIVEPTDAMKADGQALGDVVVAKRVGAPWSEDERTGQYTRVVEITVEDDVDNAVAGHLRKIETEKNNFNPVGYPYEDDTVKSTLRIDIASVHANVRASGKVIKGNQGYKRKLAGRREILND